MKKYAAIDIGTNSMRLLLADIVDGKITNRVKYINPTRIGSAVDKDKRISEEGILRNIEALDEFVQKSKAYGAEKIWVMATSAVRDASNGKAFAQRAYEKTGIKIDVISGEEEATLGYRGVVMGLRQQEQFSLSHNRLQQESSSLSQQESAQLSTLVIDIGGGSTELIIGQGDVLQKVNSLNIGAVRMTERFVTTDPMSQEEYKNMEADIQRELNQYLAGTQIYGDTMEHRDNGNLSNEIRQREPFPLSTIGIGGTITTLAALHQQLDPYDPDKVHNYRLTLGDIEALKQKLLGLTVEEIKNLKGIHPKRADIITAGITILSVIMNKLGINEITVSEYDNLEGLVHSKLG